ncbi:F420-dependent oxidoreductase-like protein [Mumia flava]|uniref:F420-dependent oxidoreductase-like protein n=1 Tax=Mumia flava TaxID=1348852 RepID=A0A0B2BFT7_9ACTN|nr:LLM class F420-dependent oxidoreductase [Mumia flava]PJJ56829.1 F420-dependent oxidoreductase-like protein [Mumia flava]
MQLRIFTEPQQGATYDDLLAVAQATERHGFDAFFRSDHYLGMGTDGLPGPTDAWTTLAGLARETERVRLGTLMTSATFRLPGVLAIQVAQVDQMSGGRVELGLGAGWFTEEHEAYGIPFPTVGERFDRFAEQLEVVTGLWRTPPGERYAFDGKHYTLVDSPALPKPVQSAPPVIVGGRGAKRTPALAARYASEFNLPFTPLGEHRGAYDRVRAACEAIDRDPDELTYSSALVVCCGEDEQSVARRAAAIGREVDELRENGLCGTPGEVAARLSEYAAAGSQRVYLQVLDLADLEHVALLGEQVLPAVADV